ncbi:MAG TPA: SRPBCC family protein [Thermomonospora sp.]|nr:SRPBCC family protein [Thermomonospora sp.]
MASIIREFSVGVDEKRAWEALADVGAVNRLITFLGDVTVEGDLRRISVGGPEPIEELIVSVDEEHRRVAYSVLKSPWNMDFHHASMQVLPPADGSSGARLRWTIDVLPHSAAAQIAADLQGAIDSIQKALAG